MSRQLPGRTAEQRNASLGALSETTAATNAPPKRPGSCECHWSPQGPVTDACHAGIAKYLFLMEKITLTGFFEQLCCLVVWNQ